MRAGKSESPFLSFQGSINYDQTSFTLVIYVETVAFKLNSDFSQKELLKKPINLIAALSLSQILHIISAQIWFTNTITLTIPKLHKPCSTEYPNLYYLGLLED